jgi:hypothetical protein
VPFREYRRPLDDSLLEWLRVQITTESGQVTTFMVQYETTVCVDTAPVVLFDTAHGFPHLDVLDRRGRVTEKVRLVDQPTLGAALTYALSEIDRTWRLRRDAFFEEEQ